MNILFPTDFSANARKAINMVIEMFKNHSVNIYLYHAYGVPNKSGGMLISIEDILLKEAKVHMEEEMKRLAVIGGERMHFKSKLVNGQLLSFVNEVIKNLNIDLIVMGTKGSSGVQGVLFGSQTLNMMRKSTVPVLAIPLNSDATFEGKFNIVLASDQKPFNSIDKLASFLGNVKAAGGPDNLQIIYVTAVPEEEKEEARYFFKKNLPETTIRYFNIIDTAITPSLESFIKEHRPDLFVLVQRRVSFFSRLLGESVTQKISLDSPVPLLILPG